VTPALDLLHRCRVAGLTLRREGQRLIVRPAQLASPALLAQLRQAKPQLLDLLEAESAQLTPDCVPWLHVARQVNCGEFDGGDRCLLDSLRIGVRNIAHPVCNAARARLETMLGRKESRR